MAVLLQKKADSTMKQIIQNYRTGELELAEVLIPFCSSNKILVRNKASLISISTECSVAVGMPGNRHSYRDLRKPLPFNAEVLEKLTNTFTFSSMKIQKEIGFKPQYNLHNTIDETVGWYQSVMS